MMIARDPMKFKIKYFSRKKYHNLKFLIESLDSKMHLFDKHQYFLTSASCKCTDSGVFEKISGHRLELEIIELNNLSKRK